MQNARVLIVDDEADVIEALKLRLETAGYQTLTASNGLEALEMLCRDEVDLVLADLMMPRVDGLELTRRVRQHPKWLDVQVLLFSCLEDQRARRLALEFGALDYLSKELGSGAIVSRVREVLRAGKTLYRCVRSEEPFYTEASRNLIALLAGLSRNTGLRSNDGSPAAIVSSTQTRASKERTTEDLRNLAQSLAESTLIDTG